MSFSWFFYLIHLNRSEITLDSVRFGPLLAQFILYTLVSLICFFYIAIASFFLYKKIGFKGKLYISLCLIALIFFQYLIATLTENSIAKEREALHIALKEIEKSSALK